ncbi:MAG: hypothetical protein HYY16_02980 [Planctomycetes bacterium]|nr:hypothetical protein [Planctomycetota bacterium]
MIWTALLFAAAPVAVRAQDVTPPVAGTVRDGTGQLDIDSQNYTWQINANWSSFTDPESGIILYEWGIGTSAGATDIQAFTSVGLNTAAVNGSLSLADGTTCYVTIRATNGVGLQTTQTSDGVTIDTLSPNAPALLAPADTASINGESGVAFDWMTVADASRYRFQLDTENTFASPLVMNLTLAASALTAGPLSPKTYYWRVFSIDGAGNVSAPSTTFSFNVVGSSVGGLTLDYGPSTPPDSNQLNTAQDLSVVQLRFNAAIQENVRVSSLRITAFGTADDAADVSSVSLYRDSDSNGLFDPGIDVLLSGPKTYPVDDGTIDFTALDQIIPAGETRDWIVVLSLSGLASIGSTLGVAIAATQEINADGVTSGQIFLPTGPFPMAGGAVTVVSSGSPGGLTVTRGSDSPVDLGSVAEGEQTVEMLQIQVNTSSVEAVRVTDLVVHGSGTGNESTHITSAFLADDSNRDGLFNAGIDTVLANGAYSADDGTVGFAFDVVIPPNTSRKWLVVYDMAATSIPSGSTYAVEVRPTAAGEVAGVGITSGLSVSVAGASFFGATKAAGITGVQAGELTITNVPRAAGDAVAPFAHDVWMATFRLSAGGLEPVLVQQVRVTASGTGHEGRDVSRATLWEDTDGDESLSEADRRVGVAQLPYSAEDGSATFLLSETIPAGAMRLWFVSYSFSGLAAEGTTFQTSFNVKSAPLPILATGAASGLSITPQGNVVSGPVVVVGHLFGSSGKTASGACGLAVPARHAAWPAAVLALLALLIARRAGKAASRRP